MRSAPAFWWLAIVLTWLTLAPASHAAGGYHVDKRLGYKIMPPSDWGGIPISISEGWIAAKFLSKKTDHWTDKSSGWTWEHKPMMQVVAFVEEIVKDTDPEISEGEKGSTVITFKNPFKNYEDYMDRTYRGGGFHVEGKSEETVGEIPVTCLDIRVERLTYNGPKRIIAWIYHLDGVDIVVQFECIEDSYKKYRSLFRKTLRSFKVVERSEGSLAEDVTGGRSFTTKEWRSMTPEQRSNWRKSLEERAHEKALRTLPDDWQSKEIGRFLVLNHAGDKFKFAKRVVTQADAVMKWLDETFSFIGTEEYVRKPILRICKDWEEEKAFRTGTFGWNNIEIVIHKDNSGAQSWEAGYVNQRATSLWFNDRDFDLWIAMPWWLKQGLQESLHYLKAKGNRVEIADDHYDRDRLRRWMREGSIAPPADLMKMGRTDFVGDFWQREQEAAHLVRFFFSSRSKQTRAVLEDYVKNLSKIVRQISSEQKDDEKQKGPTTEEEEDEWFKNKQKVWKERESRLLEETWNMTFSDWTARDWKKFETAYYKTID